jgi:hypothetical protein
LRYASIDGKKRQYLSNELQKKKKENIAAKKRQYLLKNNLTKRRLQDAPKACSKLRERVLKGAR